MFTDLVPNVNNKTTATDDDVQFLDTRKGTTTNVIAERNNDVDCRLNHIKRNNNNVVDTTSAATLKSSYCTNNSVPMLLTSPKRQFSKYENTATANKQTNIDIVDLTDDKDSSVEEVSASEDR
jgi:hypothetical protein